MATPANTTSEGLLVAAAQGAATALHFAATPTFAVMALLAGLWGHGAPTVLCSPVPGGSSLMGMTSMYLLMSVFHAAPWLKLVSGLSRGAARLPTGVRQLRRKLLGLAHSFAQTETGGKP